ncbi:hypothetical protein A3C59_00735 [Candidatus Daviesbacteria bacterium RIFCSPHIGHO2_02_FULL_36_13]|uniref:Four helix bundle protein n=1 Tax=Candidatus Daviesbacteria bacterium RIFCSPHIGHO2_02_FULL_36_13 TaxID=1797768 RepID=A0A1F5JSJ4_9BACT|nr:MAG: hypothetical protein A3C59_00735 [Candidatus Daviesbacteria bacterium RIFCSPHIGHO2_02_FULL_36_13]
MKSYKDLIVWQKSIELVKEIFQLTKLFPREETYGIVSQMRRAAVSIPSNIAEGSGRRFSNEWKQFYSIAYGSTLELETQLIISRDIKLAPGQSFATSFQLIEEVSKIIRTISSNLKKGDIT